MQGGLSGAANHAEGVPTEFADKAAAGCLRQRRQMELWSGPFAPGPDSHGSIDERGMKDETMAWPQAEGFLQLQRWSSDWRHGRIAV